MIGTRTAFALLSLLAVLAAPQPVVAADFNGDRLADFTLPGSTADTLALVLGSRAAQAPRLLVRAQTEVSLYGSGFVGDVDGDRLDDLLVAGRGRPFAVFGRRAGGEIVVNAAAPGVRQVSRGVEPRDFGDLDGDGIDDLVLVRDEDVVVIPGSRKRGALAARTFRHRGWRIAIGFARYRTFDARPAGDTNGDGIDDLLILVSDYWDCGEVVACAGPAFVVFGRRDRRTIVIPDPRWPDAPVRVARRGSPAGYAIWAMTESWGVASCGDFDGDGRDDLLFPYSRQTADSFVVYGRRAMTPVTLSGTQASFIVHPPSWGEYAAPVGDINGDGLADVVVALTPDRSAAVVFGRHRRGRIDRRALGPHGWRITGATGLGLSARPIGDINGDRRDDVLLESELSGGEGGVVRHVVLGADSTRDLDLAALGGRGYVVP